MFNATEDSYNRWKTLVPFIYDWFQNFNVQWPSLAVRWGKVVEDKQYKFTQRVYMTEQTGVFDGADANTILTYQVDIAKPRVAAAEHMLFDDGKDFQGAMTQNYGSFQQQQQQQRVSNINLGFCKKVHAIIHPGEVNNMRNFGERDQDVLVTHTDSEELLVWDVLRQPNRTFKECKVKNDDQNYRPSKPDLILSGHTDFAEFALDCHSKEYKVASGGRDKQVLVWHLLDFKSNAAINNNNNNNTSSSSIDYDGKIEGTRLSAHCTFRGHTDTVEDVAFHPEDSNIICSVSDDTMLLFWDSRCDHSRPVSGVKASDMDVHVVDWNPLNTNFIVTGGKDKIVKVWDWRKIDDRSKKGTNTTTNNTYNNNTSSSFSDEMTIMSHAHEGEILRASWSPHDANILASASDDGCLNVWDLTRKKTHTNPTTISEEENSNDENINNNNNKEDGESEDVKVKKSRYGQTPPDELMFTHSGHRNPITDFQWNPHDPWTLMSSGSGGDVASTCQFWRISDLITRPKEEVMQELEKHSAYICGRAAKPAESGETEDTENDNTSAEMNDDQDAQTEAETAMMTANPPFEELGSHQQEPVDLMAT